MTASINTLFRWLMLSLSLAAALPAYAGRGDKAKPPVKSGPVVGSRRVIFHPLVVNGEHKGKKYSVVQTWYHWPAVLVFARTESEPLSELVRRLDREAQKAREHKRTFGVAAVCISEDAKFPEKLGKWAAKEGFKRALIAVEWSPGGPPKAWRIAADADVTVIFLERVTVKAVRGYRKGELDRKQVNRIMKDVVPFAHGKRTKEES